MSYITAYRHSSWDVPWWVNPNRSEGRYNTAMQDSTQYVCLHPLGVAAELLRWLGPAVVDDLGTINLRLWVAKIPEHNLQVIDFDNAHDFGATPEDLVADDYTATHELAERVRDLGADGMVVPSAALPGTDNVVLFGPRVAASFLDPPADPDQQVPTAHAAENATPPAEVVPYVRWKGAPHVGLDHWRATGEFLSFDDPPLV